MRHRTSNIQPWHMVFASGACRDRLVAALIDEAQHRPPNIPPLPASFQHFRSELGAQVYGAMGIAPVEWRSMNEWQPALGADAFQHPLETRDAHRHTALIVEDELTTGRLLALGLAQLAQFVAEDRMR
jgi:hypothetical protein